MGGLSMKIGSVNHGKGLGGGKFAELFSDSGQACAGLGWAMYPDSNQRDILAAKSVCAGCPVRNLCLQYAVETREPWGVWGGATPEERGVKPRKHGSD